MSTLKERVKKLHMDYLNYHVAFRTLLSCYRKYLVCLNFFFIKPASLNSFCFPLCNALPCLFYCLTTCDTQMVIISPLPQKCESHPAPGISPSFAHTAVSTPAGYLASQEPRFCQLSMRIFSSLLLWVLSSKEDFPNVLDDGKPLGSC